jgi:hypothetical protein
VPTQKPRYSTLLAKTPQSAIWKISDAISVSPSPILVGQGEVITYNLTQMKSQWVKNLLGKLTEVLQHPRGIAARKHKETLLWSLGEANIADKGDLELESQMAGVVKHRKKGLPTDEEAENKLAQLQEEFENWGLRWYNEPLYKLKILRQLFGDDKIIIIQLASTHGDPFVRTFGDFKPWKKFIDWLDVKQSNMHAWL